MTAPSYRKWKPTIQGRIFGLRAWLRFLRRVVGDQSAARSEV